MELRPYQTESIEQLRHGIREGHKRQILSGIYQIRNIVSGKVYVGSAKNMPARNRQHWSSLRLGKHDNSKLQRAWDKHGEDVFVFEVLEEIQDLRTLIEREQHWIDKIGPLGDDGYNISPLAESRLGIKATEELRAKLSEAHKGRPLSDSHKAALAASKKRADVREKISKSLKGRSLSEETKRKMSVARRGNKNAAGTKQSAETIAKRRPYLLGNKFSLGFKHSAETLAKRAGRPWSESRRAAYERGKAARP